MRCLCAAIGCVAWVVLVIVFGSESTSDVVRSSFYLAIVGAIVLPPTAGVIAIFDHGLARWKRVIAICVGVIVPAAAILLFFALIAALDQLN